MRDLVAWNADAAFAELLWNTCELTMELHMEAVLSLAAVAISALFL